MARRKRLGLSITVRHPESETEHGIEQHIHERNAEQTADPDGHVLYGHMTDMMGERLIELQIRRGMSAKAAARILRKLAERIELNGDGILNLTGGTSGLFSPGGKFEGDGLGNDDSPTPEIH
jgi:hypothetical protein